MGGKTKRTRVRAETRRRGRKTRSRPRRCACRRRARHARARRSWGSSDHGSSEPCVGSSTIRGARVEAPGRSSSAAPIPRRAWRMKSRAKAEMPSSASGARPSARRRRRRRTPRRDAGRLGAPRAPRKRTSGDPASGRGATRERAYAAVGTLGGSGDAVSKGGVGRCRRDGARGVRGALRRVSADARASSPAAVFSPAKKQRLRPRGRKPRATDRPSHRRSLIGADEAVTRARAELTRSSRPRGGQRAATSAGPRKRKKTCFTEHPAHNV